MRRGAGPAELALLLEVYESVGAQGRGFCSGRREKSESGQRGTRLMVVGGSKISVGGLRWASPHTREPPAKSIGCHDTC